MTPDEREPHPALAPLRRVKASAIENGGRLTPGAILDVQAAIIAIEAALARAITIAAWGHDFGQREKFGIDASKVGRELAPKVRAALGAAPQPDLDPRWVAAINAHMADFEAEPESFDSIEAVAANIARHRLGAAPVEPEPPACPKCGHGMARTPHVCCDHPDCMVAAPVEDAHPEETP